MSKLLNARRISHQFLCGALAALMFLGPATPLAAQQAQQQAKQAARRPSQPAAASRPVTQAQPVAQAIPATASEPAAPLELSKALPEAALIVAVRPRQVLLSPGFEMLPLEVIQAAGIAEIGIDPLQAEQIIASVAPPLNGPPEYALYVGFSQPVGMPQGEIIEHTVPDTLNGKRYLQSQEPMLPSFYAPDGKSLLAAPESALQRVAANQTATGLAEKVAAVVGDDDLFVMIDIERLRPLIQMGLAAAASEIPPELHSLLEIPALVDNVRLRVNLSHAGVSELVATAPSEVAADRLREILDAARAFGIQQARQSEELAQMLGSDDPVEQALGRYQNRMIDMWDANLQLEFDGDELVLFRVGNESNPMMSVAVIGVLVGLLLPAVQAAREAARRTQSMNNLKQIMIALFNYESVHGAFPAHANYDDQGNPLLSWRVHILPYLEEQALYDQFHLDEPWDSPHNKSLIPMMPQIYLDPSSGLNPAEGRTHYLGPVGNGLFFDGTKDGRQISEFRDGLSGSVAVLQVNDQRASIWTKPDDWEFDPTAPLAGLAPCLHPGVFMAAFGDGSVQSISENIDPTVLQAMVTIAGGEVQ